MVFPRFSKCQRCGHEVNHSIFFSRPEMTSSLVVRMQSCGLSPCTGETSFSAACRAPCQLSISKTFATLNLLRISWRSTSSSLSQWWSSLMSLPKSSDIFLGASGSWRTMSLQSLRKQWRKWSWSGNSCWNLKRTQSYMASTPWTRCLSWGGSTTASAWPLLRKKAGLSPANWWSWPEPGSQTLAPHLAVRIAFETCAWPRPGTKQTRKPAPRRFKHVLSKLSTRGTPSSSLRRSSPAITTVSALACSWKGACLMAAVPAPVTLASPTSTKSWKWRQWAHTIWVARALPCGKPTRWTMAKRSTGGQRSFCDLGRLDFRFTRPPGIHSDLLFFLLAKAYKDSSFSSACQMLFTDHCLSDACTRLASNR